MKVFIVDDERPARQRLHELLTRVDDIPVAVVGEAGNGRDALTQIQSALPDVVLMDIRMPDMSGLEAAQHLAALDTPPALIFTTAYDEHAIEAFDTKAVAYLLKPVRLEQLSKALLNTRVLNRAQLATVQQAQPVAAERTEPAAAVPSAGRSHLSARLGNRLTRIPINDVYYFQAEQKYVTVRHVRGEAVIEESLKALEKEFGARFLRIHRNALVAAAHVGGLERVSPGRYELMFKTIGDRLEVSRRLAARVRKSLRTL